MNLLRQIAQCFKPETHAESHERVSAVCEGCPAVGVRTALTTAGSAECSRHDAGLTFSASPSFTASILASTFAAGSLESAAACFTSTACSTAATTGLAGGATPPSGPNSSGSKAAAMSGMPADAAVATAVAAAGAAPEQMLHSTGSSAAVAPAAVQTAQAGRLLDLLPAAAGHDAMYGGAGRTTSGPGSSTPMFESCVACPGGADAAAAAGPAIMELQVAFSAYNTRDICARDPTMRIRHLKVMATGPSAVIYKGTWQGMLVAVRFTLHKGSCCSAAASAGPDSYGPCGPAAAGGSGRDGLGASSPEHAAQTTFRRVCGMMASHCTPQRSHCIRVYACDVSRVVRAADSGSAWASGGEGGGRAAGLTVVACDWAAGAEPHDGGLSSPPAQQLPYSIHSSLDDSLASSSSDAGLSQGRAWAGAQQRCSPLAGSRQGPGAHTGSAPTFNRADDLERSGSSCCGSGGSSINSAATAASAARGSMGGAVAAVGCGVPASAGSSAHSSAHLPRPSGQAPAPAASSPAASRFHFSSVLCSCPPPACGSASPTAAAQQQPLQQQVQEQELPLSTLQGLLAYLRAAPGDSLLHTVLEQGCCGDLWHGVRCGVYDAYGSGPLGPRGAMTNLVHSARGVAAGLQQLHQAGEVHGGLCPGNVLLQWSRPNGPAHAEEGGEVMMLAGASGAAASGSRSSGSAGRKKWRRGLFAARITDCGVRRLLLGPQWQQQLAAHADLLSCTAPELLPPSCADSTAGSRQTNAELQWQPHNDIYSFGCLLYLMCTGGLPNSHRLRPRPAAGSGASAPIADPNGCTEPPATTIWPSNVWPPLRSLGEACMATDPALRPTASRVVQVLLLWESRLCSSRQQQLLQYDGTRAMPTQQPTRLNVSSPDFPTLAAAAASRNGGCSGHATDVTRDGIGAVAVALAGSGCSDVPASAFEVQPRLVEQHQQHQVAARLPGRTGSGGGRVAGGCLVLGVGSGAFSHTLDSVAEAEMTACGSGCSSGAEERLKRGTEEQPAGAAAGASSSVTCGGGGMGTVRGAFMSSPAHGNAHAADLLHKPARQVGVPMAAPDAQSAQQQACPEQPGALAAAAVAAVAVGQPVAASRSREGRIRALQMQSMP